MQPGWLLDKEGSTAKCLKYRRGPGEVLIINHCGRGWWDPMGEAKGDVFSLAQHLDPAPELRPGAQAAARHGGHATVRPRPGAQALSSAMPLPFRSPSAGNSVKPAEPGLGHLGLPHPRAGHCRRACWQRWTGSTSCGRARMRARGSPTATTQAC